MDTPAGLPTFNLRHLVIFIAVAESGSMAVAAERLHMSASAVSSALNDLERHLGVLLMVRMRAKGIRLTPTGERVVEQARLVLHHAAELQHGVGGEVVGPVRVGCYPSLGPTLLPSLVRAFTVTHPAAIVDLHEGDQNALRRQVDRGELDLALIYTLDIPAEWDIELLLTRRPHVLLHAGHPAAGDAEPLDLAALADEPMVLLDVPPSSGHARSVCAQAGFSPKVAYRTRNYETARSFVGRALGWSLLLQRPHGDVSYEGFPLVARTIGTPPFDAVGVGICWRRGTLLSRPARAFIELARQVTPAGE